MRKYRKPYRIKKKKSIFKSKFFWLSILALVIFGSIFYFLFFSDFFQAKVIKISGNEKVKIGDIEGVIQNQIIQDLKFFKTKSIFIVDLDKINKALLENFPQIAKVNLKREFPNRVSVNIEERKPVAIFNPIHPEDESTKYFFIDKNGVIFEEIREIIPGLLKIKKTIKISEFGLGEEILEKELLTKILEIENKLRNNLKIFSEEILVVSAERINVKTPEGWEIYFNPEKDLNWQITKLKAVLEENYLPKDYIDLRFGDRAFVK